MAETPHARRLRKESGIEAKQLNPWGVQEERRSTGRKLRNFLKGEDDYGTSLSAGAAYAGEQQSSKEFDKEGASVREALTSPRARQKIREAAAEERREARGYAKGGTVRGGGCETKGKTRGRFV